MIHTSIDFHLIVITNRNLCKVNLTSRISYLASKGVKAFQLREKDLSSVSLLKLSQKINLALKPHKSNLLINDRLDIAILSGAAGVHSSTNGVNSKYIRYFAPNIISGKSVHNLNEAIQAEYDGFNYLIFGPVFKSPEKIKFGLPQGLKKLNSICSAVNLPVFTVGGITPENIKPCLDSGAFGVAAIRPFMDSDNISQTIQKFNSALNEFYS